MRIPFFSAIEKPPEVLPAPLAPVFLLYHMAAGQVNTQKNENNLLPPLTLQAEVPTISSYSLRRSDKC